MDVPGRSPIYKQDDLQNNGSSCGCDALRPTVYEDMIASLSTAWERRGSIAYEKRRCPEQALHTQWVIKSLRVSFGGIMIKCIEVASPELWRR